MQRRVAILVECYLNACLANLAIKSVEIGERRVQVEHKLTYGGDRIISELKKELNEFRKRYDVIICLIDYEGGDSRRYRESAFPEVREIRQGIKVARSRWQNVYGILFDPNPEAVLGITEIIEKDSDIKNRLKSQRACETLNKIFERDSRRKREFEEILEMLSNTISKLVRNSSIFTS